MAVPDRHQLRRASTRAKIVAAADELFQSKGYTATSINEISSVAGVAIRTVYLHFDSKASILLAPLDRWLDEFVRRFAERPADEPLDAMLESVLSGMFEDNWGGNRSPSHMAVLHPIMQFMGGTDEPEIAGHILQRWVRVQDQLTEQFRSRKALPPDSLQPRIEAAAVFMAWLSAGLAFRDHHLSGVPLEHTTHEIGNLTMKAIVGGLGTSAL